MIKFYAGSESVTGTVFRLAAGFTLSEDTDGIPIIDGGGSGGGGVSAANVLGLPHTDPTASLSMYMATTDQSVAGAPNVGNGNGFIDFATFASDGGTWSATRQRPPLRFTARTITLRTSTGNGQNNPGTDALFINDTQQVAIGTSTPTVGRKLTVVGDTHVWGYHYVSQEVRAGLNGLNAYATIDAGAPAVSGVYSGTGVSNAPVSTQVVIFTARHDLPTVNRAMQFAAPVGNTADLYYRSIDAASLTSVTSATAPWRKLALRDGTTDAVQADSGVSASGVRFIVRQAVAGEAFGMQSLVYIDASGYVRRAAADIAGITPNLYLALDGATGLNSTVRLASTQGLFLDTSGFTLGQRLFLNTGTGGQFTATPPSGSGQTVILLGQVVRTTTGGTMALALQPSFMYVVG